MMNKASVFSDIHFGRHGNSDQHNEDCLSYLEWFIYNTKKENADHIIFLGDWFQNRTSINVSTLTYSHQGANMLSELELPIYFIVGNHDLYHRTSRSIFSTINFRSYKNFIVVDQPYVLKETKSLLCPFLFVEEFANLFKYRNLENWFGHFEFKGFQVTTYGYTLDSGLSHLEFQEPKYIFSGHFHKRQMKDNIVYIGNAFPMDFGDANDNERGMMIYDYNEPKFLNWKECPKYVKLKLTDILDEKVKIEEGSHLRCLLDYHIDYTQNIELRNFLTQKHTLRSFEFEETGSLKTALTETDVSEIEDDLQEGLIDADDLVIQMLLGINADGIDANELVKIYSSL